MKPDRMLKVAVVGCGSAGPAVATLLARQGHGVRLFERAPECRAVGAGFLLQPSGMAVLRELGIVDEVVAHGSRVERLHVMNPDGNDLLDLRYAELGGDMFGLGLHRPVLLHFLLKAVEAEGLSVEWGWEVEEVGKRSGKWFLRSADGREEAGFDLLIGADGARSTIRTKLPCRGIDRGYAWGAHWFIGENRGTFPQEELHQLVSGTRKLLGFLGTGHEVGGSEPLVSLFWSIRLDQDAAWRSGSLAKWKEEILRVVPYSEPLLEQIGDWSQMLTARYGDVRMRRWHGDGWVLLGDSAHAMSPQLGQGVNLALADASCLANSLASLPMAEALRRYSRERWLTLRYYSLATRQLTPWFQSDYEFLSPVRRLMFRTLQHMPPARRLMTRSMAGLVGRRATRTTDE